MNETLKSHATVRVSSSTRYAFPRRHLGAAISYMGSGSWIGRR